MPGPGPALYAGISAQSVCNVRRFDNMLNSNLISLTTRFVKPCVRYIMLEKHTGDTSTDLGNLPEAEISTGTST